MRKPLKISLIILVVPVVIILLTIGICTGLYLTTDLQEPVLPETGTAHYAVIDTVGCRSYGSNCLRQNSAGLWELFVNGDACHRGKATGILLDSLLYYQESVFVNQIRHIVPSESYLRFLRALIILFNRDLGNNVTQEYRTEIAALALSCSHEFDFIGNGYERQLNYHAAHDIGHLMQDYMLVGCSSFAAWGNACADSSMLVGRNFDFYMGDDFARNKLITCCRPDSGYNFVSIGWAGMIGVLSGMNQEGLTVTINAAKGSLPSATATPISILAREILQYAATIDEAYAIAAKRKTFVSESILIASARDGKAAIIEKSPDRMALFSSADNFIVCTNHYQSDVFANDAGNLENITTSDSPYRHARIKFLIDSLAPLTPQRAAGILRDYKGKDGSFIGLCNELAINQSIAHHSVVFAPHKRTMWISTEPWQAGEYIAYDLNALFSVDAPICHDINDSTQTIAADSLFLLAYYDDIIAYRRLTSLLRNAAYNYLSLPADTLKAYRRCNGRFYYTHETLGDYYLSQGNARQAIAEWEAALKLEIPKQGERQRIEKKIKQNK